MAWLEEYRGCGCTSEAATKAELLGYCAKHGGSAAVRYELRDDPETPVKVVRMKQGG